MKLDDFYFAGVGSWLPPRVDARAAMNDGRYDADELVHSGLVSVAVSEQESAVEMAVRAANVALQNSTVNPSEIGLVLHAGILFQGHDIWPAASYIARETLPHPVTAMEVRQMGSGAMAALQLATDYLTGGSGRNAALLTTGDRFGPPTFDRWRSDAGIVYADGGTAAVLSRLGGDFRLLSLVTKSDHSLEEMHRGDDPFTRFSGDGGTLDVKARKFAYFSKVNAMAVLKTFADGIVEVVDQALEEAGSTRADIRYWAVPHTSDRLLLHQFVNPLGIDPESTTWEWGRTVGHLGPGDQYAALARLQETGAVTAGDRIVLVALGGGLTWTAVVLEVTGT